MAAGTSSTPGNGPSARTRAERRLFPQASTPDADGDGSGDVRTEVRALRQVCHPGSLNDSLDQKVGSECRDSILAAPQHPHWPRACACPR